MNAKYRALSLLNFTSFFLTISQPFSLGFIFNYTLLVLVKPLETYEIIDKVKEAGNGLVKLAPSTMHGMLTKMEKKGFIYKVKGFNLTEKNLYALSHFGNKILEL
jgi:DNA-binding PadR family transcriptional regulator